MFGLELPPKPVTIQFPVPLPVGQYLNDLRVVGPLMEPVKGLRRDLVKVIILVDRPCTEVYQLADSVPQ